MTAYNRENYVAHAIESVLASTYVDFELVIVDDASSDRTVDICREFEARDARVSVHVNDRNLGDYANRNRAAEHARGTYIKYLDSDDFIYPHGLQVMVRCMETFPVAGLGLSAIPTSKGPAPRLLPPREAYKTNFFEYDLLARAPGSAIVRRSAFIERGGFSGKRQVGDHELWLRMASRFPVVTMPTDLVWDRHHADQEKHLDDSVEKTLMHEEVQIEALESADCPLDPSERAAARNALNYARLKNYWGYLRTPGGMKTASKYRKRANLSSIDISQFAIRKLKKMAFSGDAAGGVR